MAKSCEGYLQVGFRKCYTWLTHDPDRRRALINQTNPISCEGAHRLKPQIEVYLWPSRWEINSGLHGLCLCSLVILIIFVIIVNHQNLLEIHTSLAPTFLHCFQDIYLKN